MLFKIFDLNKKEISSNLPAICQKCSDGCNVASEKIRCFVNNEERRRGVTSSEQASIYLCTKEMDYLKSSKIFKTQAAILLRSAKYIEESKSEILEKSGKNVKRLIHNLTSLNAFCIQEVYNFIGQDELAQMSQKEQLEKIKDYVVGLPDQAAKLIIRILKNNSFMRAEFSVFNKLYDHSPRLQNNNHQIHKLITNVLYIFFSDFTDREVYINVAECKEALWIDYESITVALTHFVDNMSKYTLPGSQVYIDFESSEFFNISFDMYSLKIKDEEAEEVFNESYSGFYAKQLHLNGDGIGMYIIKKLLELNDCDLIINRNVGPTEVQVRLGIPYERNIFQLRFKKNRIVKK